MGNGWHEWPLVLFTVLGQCVVGALIVSGLGWLAMKDDAAARQRLVRSMFFLWLVMGLGFLASIMHLGSPMRAFNSLNRIGASGLSNEIAARPGIPPVIWRIRRRCKMGNGWHEWPLVLFTVLGQCVVGALIVSGLGWLAMKDDAAARQRLVRSMFFLWLVMGLGFLASIMHLGSPMRAFNSLNRIGASGLSNEIAAGSVFFAVGGIWWLVAVLGKMPLALGKFWLLVSMVLGIVFVWAMTRVYLIDTVPTWYTGYTTLAFFLTALLSGPLFAALLLRAARVTFNGTLFASISVLALLVSVAVIVLQGMSLATIHSSVQQASALVPDYASLQVWRVVLVAAGLGCWICPLVRRKEPHVAGLLLGLLLVLGGEIIGRGLFYGLHMTVGMAVAG